jgi:hypothetical protein
MIRLKVAEFSKMALIVFHLRVVATPNCFSRHLPPADQQPKPRLSRPSFTPRRKTTSALFP